MIEIIHELILSTTISKGRFLLVDGIVYSVTAGKKIDSVYQNYPN